jgi:VCBS repeat-containing protein
MAQLIGVVSKVVGSVVALAADGSRRTLLEGDRVFAGEQVQTGDSGAVAIRLENGNELSLGRDSSLALSPQTLATDSVPHADSQGEENPPSASLLTDVERIQQAIAAGQDPSVDADPTAAGATAATASGTSAGGGHSFVLLDAVGGAVAPTVGFGTAGTTSTQATSALFVSSLLAVDNPVTFPVINTLRFNESSLPDGSDPGATALRGTGSFTITAADGLTNLSVAGTNVLVNGNLVGLNQTITTALGNSIVITGLNTSTGVVNYAYTLNGAENHANGGGANNLAESIALVGGDRNGTVGNGAIVINIRDDLPTAVDDFNDDGVDEVIRTTTGNVLDNDTQGADRIASGPVSAGTFTGQYGSLALAADGSYTYTINPNAPAFIALGNGGSGSELFTYTLRDADGDSSSATLEIDVNNADNLTISATGVTVNEANLALGSAPNAAALVKTGSFTVDSSAGLSDLSINGVDILSDGVRVGVGQTITTASGDNLVVTGLNTTTGLVNYRFTLVNPEAHEAGGGANSSVLPLSIVAGDNNGNATSGSLIISVIDDVPQAVADSNSNVTTSSSLTLTGNVLSNDLQGVDRISAGPISAGTFTGTYGNLVLGANGAYTYTLNPSDADFRALAAGARGTETFTYTLNDRDGDTSTATLTLNVVGAGAGTGTVTPGTIGITPAGAALVLNEANLALGSAPNAAALTQAGSFNVAASGGLNNLSINGVTVLSNGQLVGLNQNIDTRLGNTLKVTGLDASTGVVTYSYTLNGSETHATANGANSLADALNVVASDRSGASASATINVGITDDLPRAVADSNSGTASQAMSRRTSVAARAKEPSSMPMVEAL